MRITKQEAIRNFKNLKNNNPKKFQEIKRQFISMSLGENGGRLYSCQDIVSVREHYYKGWDDNDFLEVLSEINKF